MAVRDSDDETAAEELRGFAWWFASGKLDPAWSLEQLAAVGQALQRTLLIAAATGVRASFLNQPVQVPALRTRLRALLGEPGEGPGRLLRTPLATIEKELRA